MEVDVKALFIVLVLLLVSMTTTTVLLAHGGEENDDNNQKPSKEVKRQLKEVKKATKQYKDLQEALDDGYVQVTECIGDETQAEGYHYALLDEIDENLDPLHPEILVYLPKKNGKMKLVAVEYATPDTIDPIPSLFGVTFNHIGEPFNLHRLHVWIYEKNPDGVFVDFNPRLKCPSE